MLLIAHGRGIAQLLTMARERARLRMPFELHYLSDRHTQGLFSEELAALADAPDAGLYVYDGSARPDLFAPEYVLGGFDQHKHVYVSGDHDFVWQTIMAGGRLGWRASHVHSSEPAAMAVPDQQPAGDEKSLPGRRAGLSA
ncbi:hypothetical protein Q4485_01640 [Granulosicoccaceae sp. 1_MG-2023]|nr:hypothetical protein [Granulosicoccaceae sp. 1_MG-2023]